MKVFLRTLPGFIPSFALAAIAIVLSAYHENAWSLTFSASSITYTILRARLLNRRRAAEQAARAHPITRQVKPRGRQPFAPFVACPGCGTHAYHLFGPDHEVLEAPASWEPVMYQIWNTTGTFKVRSDETVADPLPVRVIDRECLQCETTWQETP